MEEPSNSHVLRPGGIEVEVDPLAIRFTHQSISPFFRSGDLLDDIISLALHDGPKVMDSFPPMELVQVGWKTYSISNRRLYVFRCLVRYGLLQKVKAVLYSWKDPRIQQLRFDFRLGRLASKWERSFTTNSDGQCVDVASRFYSNQFSSPTSMEVYHVGTEKSVRNGAIDPRRRDRTHQTDAFTSPALWHPACGRYGVIDGPVFTKTKRAGAMKMFYESVLREGGRHRYRVELLDGQLAPSDGIGFVFADHLGKDIQGIQSIFVNRRGLLCKRFTNGTMFREPQRCLAMAIGMLFDLDIDLDAKVAILQYKTPEGWQKLPDWDISDVILPHRSGYFCVAFSNVGMTVKMDSVEVELDKS